MVPRPSRACYHSTVRNNFILGFLAPSALQHHQSAATTYQEQRRAHRHPVDPITTIAIGSRSQRYASSHTRHQIHHTTSIPTLTYSTKYISSNQKQQRLQHPCHKESVFRSRTKRFAYGRPVGAEVYREDTGSWKEVKLWPTIAAWAWVRRKGRHYPGCSKYPKSYCWKRCVSRIK